MYSQLSRRVSTRNDKHLIRLTRQAGELANDGAKRANDDGDSPWQTMKGDVKRLELMRLRKCKPTVTATQLSKQLLKRSKDNDKGMSILQSYHDTTLISVAVRQSVSERLLRRSKDAKATAMASWGDDKGMSILQSYHDTTLITLL
jgi:hypothetical protein